MGFPMIPSPMNPTFMLNSLFESGGMPAFPIELILPSARGLEQLRRPLYMGRSVTVSRLSASGVRNRDDSRLICGEPISSLPASLVAVSVIGRRAPSLGVDHRKDGAMQDSASQTLNSSTEGSKPTRREFLAAAGAGVMTAASYRRILGANDRVGIGVIGFGLIGKQHIADLKKFKDVELLGMCDVYKPRLDEGLAYMESPNAKGYSDFRKMYEDKRIQGVLVATPDHWHALHTILACAAGKDVYVEKPMTLFIDEGKWMVQAARKYNRIVVVGTQRRHGRGVREARDVVQSGTIGKIHSIRWSSYRNIYPGFGVTPVTGPASGLRLRHVAGAGGEEAVPGPSRALSLPLVLGLLRRPDDQPGRAHHRPDPLRHERQGSDARLLDGRTVRAGRRWRHAGHPGRHVGVPGSHAGRSRVS